MRSIQRIDDGESRAATILTVLGIVSTLLTILTQLGIFGDFRLPGLPGKMVQPELSLSRGSGPSGTTVTLTGSGFDKGETVDIRFHTERIATARVDDDGTFSVDARIPGSFDAFAPQQFDIVATGRSSIGTGRVPFRLTTSGDSGGNGGTQTVGPVEPELSLSRGSGPSGTTVTVRGSGFRKGETVDIRFHTERIATARVDDDGTFSVDARVPGSFDAFAPQQFDIVATGRSSSRSASLPFALTD